MKLIELSFRNKSLAIAALFCGTTVLPLAAHVGDHPSVHDTVAGVLVRMKREWSPGQLVGATVPQVESFLTTDERTILGSEHLRFTVDVPVRVYVVRDLRLGDEPFWLQERGFESGELSWRVENRNWDVWQKASPAGEIGLGIPRFGASGRHYIVLLQPQREGDSITVTDIYPANLRTAPLRNGTELFVNRSVRARSVPEQLASSVVIQTDTSNEGDAQLVGLFSQTDYPASEEPDQVVLTWSDDPRTTQTIQWRTSTDARRGRVQYQKKSDFNRFNPRRPETANAITEELQSSLLANDPAIHRHTVVLSNLEPGTTYVYSVGDGSRDGWTELAEFTTAPSETRAFSFVYMGDAQNGLDRWGTLLHNAFRHRPDAAFYLMAGDLVDRGNERWDWDSFFANAEGVFNQRQLVPALGNHEYQGGQPELYPRLFALPQNGPDKIPAERAYSFEYSNAKFIILDSNLDPRDQTDWLEQQLANTGAIWKFVAYHHPAYSSVGNRDNERIRNAWVPLFDKYHVDLALQGHDHAYLRTHPMRNNERVAEHKDGTTYIVSVSGTKMYDQGEHDYTEVGFTKVATYQVLDIQIDGNRLVYRAYDIDGDLRDEFVIEK